MTSLCSIHDEPLPCRHCLEAETGLTQEQLAALEAKTQPNLHRPWLDECPSCKSPAIHYNSIGIYYWCGACGSREWSKSEKLFYTLTRRLPKE